MKDLPTKAEPMACSPLEGGAFDRLRRGVAADFDMSDPATRTMALAFYWQDMALAQRGELERTWHVLKDFGAHPGRTDDRLADSVRAALKAAQSAPQGNPTERSGEVPAMAFAVLQSSGEHDYKVYANEHEADSDSCESGNPVIPLGPIAQAMPLEPVAFVNEKDLECMHAGQFWSLLAFRHKTNDRNFALYAAPISAQPPSADARATLDTDRQDQRAMPLEPGNAHADPTADAKRRIEIAFASMERSIRAMTTAIDRLSNRL